ncbi:MAG: pyridoxal phosphate-dependent aminotransferase [Anaerolineales bacterium]|nr:pyridoxal phosphate-dependent aminotransferase [Anaerolineales bacterium]
MEPSLTPGFRSVPRTGVIYVMHEAAQLGFTYGDPEWANLGQGSPETGELPEAPPRVASVTITPPSRQYSAIEGNLALREAVADFYNLHFRRGKTSQYTARNVSIANGGRLALTRLGAALGNVNMGHFIPDYTAYEELLGVFKAFTAIPILLEPRHGYHIALAELENEILGRGLSALLVSNPCNPTGQVVEGGELSAWCDLARSCRCSLIFDEFYSHYLYDGEPGRMNSAAALVHDVDGDPIIIVDGLTKNWRYPGWRMSWTLAPRDVVDVIASAGSFLDGGPNHPFQGATLELLRPEFARAETLAIQKHFRKKRYYTLERLKKMGFRVDVDPAGTFYVWVNLERLPAPIRDGMGLFREGLKEKVITIPGIFFDVNPDKRRFHARYEHYARISFGPEMETLERGLDALERVIRKFR